MSPVSVMSRRIEDYAMIGSTHSAALVHRNGTIEWLCMPRFDSEAIFASLLGTPENGEWVLRATDPAARISRRYVPDTMILETTIETPQGRAVVQDFMPTPVDGDLHELIRIIRGIEGTVSFAAELRLRFNYGAWIPWVERREGAIFAFAGPDAIRLSSSVDLSNANFSTTSDFTIVAGQSVATTLEWFPSHKIPPLPRDPYALLRHTEAQGRLWASQCTYEGPYAETVRRSLMTLKALTYHPTGGIVAAPTTSLPEDPGGSRNWDYRYCWLRDAVWTLHALTVSGYMEEASAWRWWLMRATAGAPDGLQIMYGLHGERRLTETTLDHLAGYENSRPVRIGNAAHGQLQLDVYGSLLGAFDAARRDGLPDMDAIWPLQRSIADRLLVLWREPDSSLWEIRGPKQHFVYSKMMCWFAFDRTIASAVDFGLEGPIDTWRQAREEIHAQVCEKGFDGASNSFVQYYGADRVDASLLQIPLLGFLPADDPRVQGTVARIERELLHNNVVYRYLPEGVRADGLEGREGAFLACSFWLCDAYIMSHRMDEARALFERLLTYGNDLGLFSEEYDPVARRQLGNFPQAFSHFALVHTAHMLAGGVIDASGQRRRKK
ncbi:glycoside hydrolase family 15 protein [Novacetimonas pomaceti]|uniref:Glucoamylase n=1 Tax=Novacetimonas pomaceti TaxID=2021998 RepID=A0A318QD94_9PROT|nr:glycoside hydrolase family 15 protein [Novacetimonas pomaceti]MBV1832545.1 glycoside hydrolase family 15 protein [Novacetimonas pomaceti]PYD75531.1 glucoamylase [Novacetimonas pomaceti]